MVLVQSTKLLYMRRSPVYILRASWQPSGQPRGIHKVTMWRRTRQRLMGKGVCPCDVLHKERGKEKRREKGERNLTQTHRGPESGEIIRESRGGYTRDPVEFIGGPWGCRSS